MLSGLVLQPSGQLAGDRAFVVSYLSSLCSDDDANTTVTATTVISSSTAAGLASMSKLMGKLISDPDADWIASS